MYVPGRQAEYTWYGTRRPEEYKFKFPLKQVLSVAKTAASMTPMGRAASLASAGLGAAKGLAGGLGGGGGAGAGAPIGMPGGGGGAGAITINNPPIKLNVQVSGKDMAASSGVFSEEIGVPGMTDNTMAPAAAPGAAEDDDAGGGSRRRKKPRRKAGFGKKAGGRRSRYTEEFSSGPQLEESDRPLVAFALIAILISLFCD